MAKSEQRTIKSSGSALEYEMGVIEKMGFISYFLITQDFYHLGEGARYSSRARPWISSRIPGCLCAEYYRFMPDSIWSHF